MHVLLNPFRVLVHLLIAHGLHPRLCTLNPFRIRIPSQLMPQDLFNNIFIQHLVSNHLTLDENAE